MSLALNRDPAQPVFQGLPVTESAFGEQLECTLLDPLEHLLGLGERRQGPVFHCLDSMDMNVRHEASL
jgi:hypothetical protein